MCVLICVKKPKSGSDASDGRSASCTLSVINTIHRSRAL